jgi:hypothetical protein
MYSLHQISSPADIKSFIKFPFKLYKDDKYWVPPIIQDEINYFNPEKNQLLKKVFFHLYLVKKGEEIVGRSALIINWDEVLVQKKRNLRFGWFDVIDDIEVTKLILAEAEKIATENQLETIEGPIGVTNLDKVGIITEGYETIGSMGTWYNFPYYVSHLEQLGFVKEKTYIQNRFNLPKVMPESFIKANDMIRKRYQLRVVDVKSTKDILPYVEQIFDLFSETYSRLKSFVPITTEQKEYLKKQFIPFINPEYIKLVVDKDNRLIAYGITMPSFSKALQKANGKLFPFGLIYLLYAKKFSKTVEFYLISIDEAYQSKGVIAIIFCEFQKSFAKLGIKKCFNTPILEDNANMLNNWKHFNAEVYRKRSTFVKKVG